MWLFHRLHSQKLGKRRGQTQNIKDKKSHKFYPVLDVVLIHAHVV